MSLRIVKNLMGENPQYMERLMEVSDNMWNLDYWKQRPGLAAATFVPAAMSLGAGAVGAWSTLAPENEAAQSAAEYANIVNPIVDTASEYVSNRYLDGLSRAQAGYLAGMSGAGHVGGQYLASKFLPRDEEGNQNQLAVTLAGLGGELVTDQIAEMTYDPVASGVTRLRQVMGMI